jgi:tetraacyldisaccharide 4'-kinase
MKTPAFWQHNGLTSALLAPFSWLYGIGAALDRSLTTAERAPLPVISIGNVTAGGAGKTPTALALAPLLEEIGAVPHYLTRGYGGDSARVAHRVTAADGWQQVGDEALLLASRAPTWVGRDRFASAIVAEKAGATIAICDDALQHHALAKDLSLLVIDGPYGIGNGCLLPAGPLREPLAAALARCHGVVLIGEDAHNLAAHITLPVFRAQLVPEGDLSWLMQGTWLAFAGIGRPEKFFDSLRRAGATLAATHAFPDHHPYSDTDLATLTTEAKRLGAKLITTEKDAVKFTTAERAHIATLPVTLRFEDAPAFAAFLRQKLA